MYSLSFTSLHCYHWYLILKAWSLKNDSGYWVVLKERSVSHFRHGHKIFR